MVEPLEEPRMPEIEPVLEPVIELATNMEVIPSGDTDSFLVGLIILPGGDSTITLQEEQAESRPTPPNVEGEEDVDIGNNVVVDKRKQVVINKDSTSSSRISSSSSSSSSSGPFGSPTLPTVNTNFDDVAKPAYSSIEKEVRRTLLRMIDDIPTGSYVKGLRSSYLLAKQSENSAKKRLSEAESSLTAEKRKRTEIEERPKHWRRQINP